MNEIFKYLKEIGVREWYVNSYPVDKCTVLSFKIHDAELVIHVPDGMNLEDFRDILTGHYTLEMEYKAGLYQSMSEGCRSRINTRF
jgi:hypothetical protein